MSSKDFFITRYKELGWKHEDVTPRQAIRINTINVEKTATILQRLQSIGITLERISFLDHGYWVCESKFSVGATSEYLLGLYSIQEAAAQIPVTLFTESEDKTVLDACAAPGGKTVQLADSMHNTGAIIALDIRKQRLTALANQLERCRVKNTVVYFLDARQVSELKASFDRILLDMPCSGNFAADENWFKRRTINDVKRNAALQREIMTETVKVLNDNGEIVYSTCSLEPEENELNIDWAVRNLSLQVEEISCHGQEALTNVFGKYLDSSIEKCRRIWPGQTQGFFVCKLKRRNAA
ncbi:MAG: RsmB/NOP family class I SAM-dependent RNA methyltransferase [Candidatus Bathyarchaeia archaeon]|jgi:NOL1/NOP2/sun family putative RNA methylase